MVIFHNYVSLPEGNPFSTHGQWKILRRAGNCPRGSYHRLVIVLKTWRLGTKSFSLASWSTEGYTYIYISTFICVDIYVYRYQHSIISTHIYLSIYIARASMLIKPMLTEPSTHQTSQNKSEAQRCCQDDWGWNPMNFAYELMLKSRLSHYVIHDIPTSTPVESHSSHVLDA